MSTNLLQLARRLTKSGISVIPIRADGSKAPAIDSWKEFQERIPSETELNEWFSRNGVGIAIICGKVSGNLEIIDFEDIQIAKQWAELVKAELGDEVLNSFPVILTPGGGCHLPYRCNDGIERNQKLAQKTVTSAQDKEEPEVLIETRAKGGYVLAAGSPAACHPSGKPYRLVRGDLADIPEISAEQRRVFLDCARAFNQYHKTKTVFVYRVNQLIALDA